MFALRRVVNTSTVKATRQMATRTRPVMAGGAHHDDHAHHEHPLWETLPFKKSSVFAMTWGSLIAGSTIIVVACVFQNWKHGFLGKK